MSMVERIQELCNSKDTTLIGLEREVNFGRGTIRNWDKNSPSIDKVIKVADYFHVSLDYLLGREEYPLSPETLKIVSLLEGKEITPQRLSLIMQYLDTLFE